jgi:tetratricopeptide (TPR) repeat protein
MLMLTVFRIHRKFKTRKYAEGLLLFPEESKMTSRLLVYRALFLSKIWNFSAAKEDLDRVKKAGKFLFFVFNNQGCMYLLQQRFIEALEELKEARRLNPNHPYAMNNYGLALMFSGELEEGVKLIEDSLKRDKWNYNAMRNIGIYYLLKREYKDAFVVFIKVRAKDQYADDLDIYLAITYLKLEDNFNHEVQTQRFSELQIERYNSILLLIP